MSQNDEPLDTGARWARARGLVQALVPMPHPRREALKLAAAYAGAPSAGAWAAGVLLEAITAELAQHGIDYREAGPGKKSEKKAD